MRYWLIKSEPGTWSWADQCAAAGKRTAWTGVRNAQAQIYMKQMAVGDQAMFYHSGKDKAVVGIVEIVKAAYADETDATGKWVAVDVKAVGTMRTPVTLSAIKGDKRLSQMALVRQSRLSVGPVEDAAWGVICKMGEGGKVDRLIG